MLDLLWAKPLSDEEQWFLESMAEQEREDCWCEKKVSVCVVGSYAKGELVGLAGIDFRFGFIPSLFVAVKKAYQGQGRGGRLVRIVCRLWRLPLFLTYFTHKTKLKSFYERLGFKDLGEWKKGINLMVKI